MRCEIVTFVASCPFASPLNLTPRTPLQVHFSLPLPNSVGRRLASKDCICLFSLSIGFQLSQTSGNTGRRLECTRREKSGVFLMLPCLGRYIQHQRHPTKASAKWPLSLSLVLSGLKELHFLSDHLVLEVVCFPAGVSLWVPDFFLALHTHL